MYNTRVTILQKTCLISGIWFKNGSDEGILNSLIIPCTYILFYIHLIISEMES